MPHADYLLILLADHGMVPMRENVDLAELLEGLEAVICPSHRGFSLPTAREKAVRRVAAALRAIRQLKDELEGRA